MNKELLNLFNKTLCPPGEGVFTVHTATNNKVDLYKKLYNTTDMNQVRHQWLENIGDNDKVYLFGITSDTGGGIQRGANWGPLFIRNNLYNEIDQNSINDLGDVRTIPHLLHDKYLNEKTISECQKALYDKDNDLPVSPLSIAELIGKKVFHSGKKILTLGGDHSVSYPMVKTWIESRTKNHAILHFDAHTDLLKRRLGIDICFGSWAYHMIPLLKKPEHMVQYGIRSSGKNKQHWENEFGIKQYWSDEIKSNCSATIKQIVEHFKSNNIEEVYISFDIDALDEEYASATGTPEPNGLALHHCTELIETIGENFSVTGADLVEVAPFVNANDKIGVNEPHTTLLSSTIILRKLLEAMNA